jgi:hypothetical protein
LSKSISSSAQYVILQKYFLHPSLVSCFFPKPTHKTKTGTANRWETTNSKAPGPIIIGLANQKQGAAVRSDLSHSSLACLEQLHWHTRHGWELLVGFYAHFYQPTRKLCKNAKPKPICYAKQACFDFSSSKFLLQGHIVSTGGGGLKNRESLLLPTKLVF